MNVRSKLAKARLMFLQKNVGKSGKNMHLEFMYFELEDIVPAAIQIFAEVGLVTVTNFDDTKASMTVYDADDTEDGIEFSVPYREMKPIISNAGKEVTNPMQALGSSITYLRRYLYMMVLDIVEHDEIDANLGADQEEVSAPAKKKKEKEEVKKPTAPPTPAKREEIKKELTSEDGAASEEEITALKSACKALLTADPGQNDFVTQIALKTDGFTKIVSSVCRELTKNIEDMVKAYGGDE